MSRFFYGSLYIWFSLQSLFGFELSDLKNERLQFDLIFKGLNAVRSDMWLELDDSTTTLNWTLNTKPVAKFLFRVQNSYQVTLDSSGEMIRAQKSINQKNIQQEWTIDYNWTAHRAVSNQGHDWPIVKNCFNVLTMLYDVRTKKLAPGDSITYALDIESQIWTIKGIVTLIKKAGNLTAHEIVFHFSPALDIVERAWKTDIVTNRMGNDNSTLTIQLGPPPEQKPLLVRFGSDSAQIEMHLKQ